LSVGNSVQLAAEVLEEGATQPLTATVYDADDNVLTGRGIMWTSLEPGIALVDPGGMVTALRPGITTVTAKVDGKTATAAIRVAAYYPFELLYRCQVDGACRTCIRWISMIPRRWPCRCCRTASRRCSLPRSATAATGES
jgi:hypothetical protein